MKYRVDLRNRWHRGISPAVRGVFDANFYLTRYPDVASAGHDPMHHYQAFGAAEGRSPNALFDPVWYLAANQHLQWTRGDPLLHYLEHGGFEGRDPHPLFDSAWYLAQNDDIAPGINPLVHYLSVGQAEQRDPHPLFDTSWYVAGAAYAHASDNPVGHYLAHWARSGLNPHPLFDSGWYLAENPDVAEQGINPLIHFVSVGWREGRDPNPFFDTDWYLKTNPDVAAVGTNPLIHFVISGEMEPRSPSRKFSSHWYLDRHFARALEPVAPLTHYLTQGREQGLAIQEVYPAALPKSRLTPVQAAKWPLSLMILSRIDIPQCIRYRITQKLQMCAMLDVPVRWVDLDPEDPTEALNAVQSCRLLIVYRLPDSAVLAKVLEDAKRLGVPVIYETDDLVYRSEIVARNPNLSTLPESIRTGVISGAEMCLAAIRRADHVLASTQLLANDLQAEVAGQAFVVENGIDADMLEIAEAVLAEVASGKLRDRTDGRIIISYGSGSRAHDADLALAAPALSKLMSGDRRVCLELTGPLRVPEELRVFGNRIVVRNELVLAEFLRQLAASDITIAPLVDAEFNHYKSQVKYLEAALMQVPMVASPTVYGRYIRHGETGLLAESDDEWFEALGSLVADTSRRVGIAAAARRDVRRWELPNDPAAELNDLLTRVLAEQVPT